MHHSFIHPSSSAGHGRAGASPSCHRVVPWTDCQLVTGLTQHNIKISKCFLIILLFSNKKKYHTTAKLVSNLRSRGDEGEGLQERLLHVSRVLKNNVVRSHCLCFSHCFCCFRDLFCFQWPLLSLLQSSALSASQHSAECTITIYFGVLDVSSNLPYPTHHQVLICWQLSPFLHLSAQHIWQQIWQWLSWCHMHLWTPLCSDMVFVMKSSYWSWLGFSSGK